MSATPGAARREIRRNATYVRDLLRQIEAAAKRGDWSAIDEIANEASCAVADCGTIAMEVTA